MKLLNRSDDSVMTKAYQAEVVCQFTSSSPAANLIYERKSNIRAEKQKRNYIFPYEIQLYVPNNNVQQSASQPRYVPTLAARGRLLSCVTL